MGPVFLWYKEITHVQTVHVHVHQLHVHDVHVHHVHVHQLIVSFSEIFLSERPSLCKIMI